MKKYSAVLLFVSLLIGCVQMQVSTAADDADAKAKALSAPKGKALLYIIRPTNIGKPFAHEITLDGKKIGSTCGYYYVYTIVAPGKHKLTATGDFTGKLEITTESGKIYYIQQKVLPGVWKGGASLSVVSETEGRKILSECKLSGDNTAGL